MKSYTDIEQSKKLAEILPLESADMGWYYSRNPQAARNQMWAGTKAENADTPCWSLTSLLNLCPTINEKQPILTRGKITRLWYCYYEDEMDTQTYDNPVDACVAMIEELHEQKLL